jgi:hypothetical protein
MSLTLALLLTVPTLLLGILAVAIPVLLAVAGLLAVRRWAPVPVDRAHHEVVGSVLQVVGVAYAVLLAFMVYVVWTQMEEAERHVAQEVNALSDLFMDAQWLPEPSRQAVQTKIRAYAQTVVEREWTTMSRGKASSEASRALDGLWLVYQSIQPQTPAETAAYAESLRRLNEAGGYRRLRLLSSRGGVVGVLWVLLVVGGMVTVGLMYLYHLRSVWIHDVLIAALTGMIAFILLLVLLLDHPFTGKVRVSPEAFEQALERWAG